MEALKFPAFQFQVEGIIRINPENDQEEHARDQLNKGVVPEDIGVHCLASMIKARFMNFQKESSMASPLSKCFNAIPKGTTIPPPVLSNPHEIAFQQLQQQQQHRQEEQLQAFWAGQLTEAEQQAEAGEVKLKAHHSLPLARIKKIMKADADVKMVAAEAPAVFARACEMFILELMLRAWLHAEGARRRTLQRGDVTAAIHSTEAYDFLTDIVPEEERSWSAGDGVPPATTTTTAVPVIVPPPPAYGLAPVKSVPFATYVNMQPITYMWAPPPPEHRHQQNSDGGRDQQE
ncbi:nuclear transcription factor Y subunit C-2-like [Miscanthus floridulus]|uniref:nuclear transcription factor Y subunit C-2-like n=1 Tax=Miscanthus floridulus TaxID=154761 RepID=UPI00345ACED5